MYYQTGFTVSLSQEAAQLILRSLQNRRPPLLWFCFSRCLFLRDNSTRGLELTPSRHMICAVEPLTQLKKINTGTHDTTGSHVIVVSFIFIVYKYRLPSPTGPIYLSLETLLHPPPPCYFGFTHTVHCCPADWLCSTAAGLVGLYRIDARDVAFPSLASRCAVT